MPLGSNVIVTIFPPENVVWQWEQWVSNDSCSSDWAIIIWLHCPKLSLECHVLYDVYLRTTCFLIWISMVQNLSKTINPKADYRGIVYSTIGFGALLYGFSEAGNKGWGSTEIVIMFIIGVVFIILFAIRELTMKAPMLNLEVLKSPTYTLTTIINMVVMMSLFGGMILLPLYLQNLRGFSALDSGLLLLPGSLLMGY